MSATSFAEPLVYMLAAIAILFAAAYNIFSLRNGEAIRRAEIRIIKAELLMNIYSRLEDSEFLRACNTLNAWQWKDYEDYTVKYGPDSDPELELKRDIVGNYFESVGILVKRGLIDISEVDDRMSSYVLGYWGKFGPMIKEYRKRNSKPEAGEHIEYLYVEVRKVNDAKYKD